MSKTICETKIRELYRNSSEKFKKKLVSTFGQDFFTWDPLVEIQNFNDVLKFHAIDPPEFWCKCLTLPNDEKAYKKIKLIVAAYNNHIQPDWSDEDQIKYYPFFKMVGSAPGFSYCVYRYVCSNSYVGSRLVFLKKEHMLDAVKKFEEDYKNFFS